MAIRHGESHCGNGLDSRGIHHIQGRAVADYPGLLSTDAVSDAGTKTQCYWWIDSDFEARINTALPTDQNADGWKLARHEKNYATAGGESNYTGTGLGLAEISVGAKASPILVTQVGAHYGFQAHMQQNIAMTAATHAFGGLYVTATHGNVTSTNGSLNAIEVYARNPSTGLLSGYIRGALFMIYCASGSKAKYKIGLHVDVLDLATTHYSGGGTQGILLQMNMTSITNNQVDCILINQNSAQYAFSGITFKGKIGATAGNGACVNFVGSGDTQAEGNKQNLFKFRTGSTTYKVTPAQFKSALGANCTAI